MGNHIIHRKYGKLSMAAQGLRLAYCDDDRIERMFGALHRQARDLQILVFTCPQRAFEELGGHSLQMAEWAPEGSVKVDGTDSQAGASSSAMASSRAALQSR